MTIDVYVVKFAPFGAAICILSQTVEKSHKICVSVPLVVSAATLSWLLAVGEITFLLSQNMRM